MNIELPNVVVGSGECWLPFVQLLRILEKTAENPMPESLDELDQYLNRYRGCFRTLFTTKPKNQKERDYIKSGATEPISLPSSDAKQLLPKEWVAETMLLSDIMDFNEFQALDLLVTAEGEISNYPCWPRGLIAVNMYYEGRHALISSLHLMAQLLPGLKWGSHVSPKVLEIIKPFVDNLFSDNLIDKILDLIPKFEIQKQMDLLDGNLALGDWRHRTEILKYLTGIRIELAQVIFCLAAQQRLSWKTTQRILEYLRHIELKRDVKLHKEDVLLICAVVFGLDNNINEENFDKNYALEFRKYLLDAENKGSFLCRELAEFFNLNYYTAVYKLLSDITINYQPTAQGRPILGKGMETSKELLGEDELEFKTDVFTFLKVEIFGNEGTEVSEEPNVMLRFHKLFTEFINFMPMKLRDMKVRSEDAAKTMLLYLEQGICPPPQVPVEYDSLLDCMGTFYSLDKESGLAEVFFSPHRKSIALSKFVRSLCYDSPPMFVSNVKFMTGMARSYPHGVFELLKPNRHNLSFAHFFESITKYLSSFGKISSNPDYVVEQNPSYPKVGTESTRIGLRPHELNGIITYLKLIQAVCSELTSKRFFIDMKCRWIKLLLTGAGIRSLPMEVRAEMLKTTAAMIPSDSYELDTVVGLWETFYAAQLIQPGSGDFRDELEERETRMESYILCNGFLQLLDALVKARSAFLRNYLKLEGGRHIVRNETPFLDNLVGYVRDAVLMKLAYRTYRSVPERWETASLSISILSYLLDEVPVLMIQFLSDSPVLKAVLNILVDCTKVREMSTGKIPYVDQASWEVLNLIYQVLLRQDAFLDNRGKFAGGTVLHGIHDLILSINIVTGRAEYLIALLKFIDKFNPDKHQELSLQILTAILTQHSELEGHLYTAITNDSRQALMLEYTFAQCLSNPDCATVVKQNILKLLRCSAVNPAPNLGLFLLGVDKKIDFQYRDKSKPARSILHYMLENVDELPDVFLTLLELLRDDRLRDPLLRHLRATQFFVKYYMKSFSSVDMDIKDIGYFLKCLSVDLKNSQQIGALGHALVSKDSHKFLNILERVDLNQDEKQLPVLEFFEPEHVEQAIIACEYVDRDYKAKLIDLNRLKKLFDEQMKKLEKTTTLQLKQSVKDESLELLNFAKKQNDVRRTEASKVLLFDCWKQCLEVIILMPSTLKVAGVDFVTSVLRLVIDKMTNTEAATEAFLRLGAETVLSLCGVLRTFKDDLSESLLNLILTSLCTWISTEGSVTVRGLLYPSILNLMEIMREQKKTIISRTNFAVIIDPLCKDCLHAADTGKISSMYLLGELINWSVGRGYGGRIPPVDNAALLAAAFKSQLQKKSRHSNMSFRIQSSNGSLQGDEVEVDEEGMPWDDISLIPPADQHQTQRFHRTPMAKHTTTVGTIRKPDATFQPLNSTILPVDVRDKQHISPGDWQAIKNNDTFLAFIQKQDDELPDMHQDNEVSVVQAASNSGAKSTIMNYMQTKGLVRHLIASLTGEDDLGLVDLFSCPMESINLRALLIFRARMHILNRFAKAGSTAALILLEDNLIPRLTDMHTFKMAARMKLWEPKRTDYLEGGYLSIDAQIAKSTAAQQASHLDSVFVSVWSLMHSMESSLPTNAKLADQIWRFIQINKDAAVSLLGRCPSEKEPEAEIPEPLALFTSLLAKLPEKIPEYSLEPNDDVYDKIVDTLKDICRKNVLTTARAALAADLLQFLHGYSKNPKIIRESKRFVPNRPVLISCMNYQELPPEASRQGVTVGDILRLIQLAAHRIPRWEGPTEVLNNLVVISEIGLTLVYNHMDIYVRSPFPLETERRPVASSKHPTANLQNDVAYFLEETLVKTMKEAVEVLEQRAPNSQYVYYMQYIFRRVRRVSHIKRI